MQVSVPLRGVGCFYRLKAIAKEEMGFRPLAGCGLFHAERRSQKARGVSVPLRGVGCFLIKINHPDVGGFPSPCGVWVVSGISRRLCGSTSFRPLAGCGLFLVSAMTVENTSGFRPLAGCGLFRGDNGFGSSGR